MPLSGALRSETGALLGQGVSLSSLNLAESCSPRIQGISELWTADNIGARRMMALFWWVEGAVPDVPY